MRSPGGLCGHYASALTALWRSADVSTRVVKGYRGGQRVKPLGGVDDLELRQSDAHAWVEVWLDGSGWQRVDPTRWIDTTAEAPLSQQLQPDVISMPESSWWNRSSGNGSDFRCCWPPWWLWGWVG